MYKEDNGWYAIKPNKPNPLIHFFLFLYCIFSFFFKNDRFIFHSVFFSPLLTIFFFLSSVLFFLFYVSFFPSFHLNVSLNIYKTLPCCTYLSDSDIVLNELEFHSHYWVHFYPNNLGKHIKPSNPPSYRLNSSTTVFLQMNLALNNQWMLKEH